MFEYLIILLIVIGLSECIKRINLLSRNWIPLLNLFIANCLSFAYFGIGSASSVQIGLAIGLISTGLCCTIYHTVLLFE